ncbi:MAG TPA: hypothetical protein VE826_01855 [Dongiaceae bacterium]|nr:hypothetical protein [Dongiaceae bacterium]
MRFATLALGDTAAVVAAARAGTEPFLLLVASGARPRSDAFAGIGASLGERTGVIGGAMHAAGVRHFGWMLAPAQASPLPFELAPVSAPLGEAGADARVRGEIDVVAPGMVLAARELLLEPLPSDPVAAVLELCARARAAGRDVVCRPSFACDAPPLDADDRGRFAALRAVAALRPELKGSHRVPAAARRATVERELRMPGGRRTRARAPMPPLTVLVHGAGAELAARRARDLAPATTARAVQDAAGALRAEMRVRGDRYVLVAEASHVPDTDALAALAEAVESAPYVALAAPDAASLDGRCALLALARFPQHVDAAGATLADALASLAAAARALRRAVRAPGARFEPLSAPARRSATIVFAAASSPEILKLTLTAVVEASRDGDELVAVCAPGAATTRRIIASYPQARVADDAADPLLTVGVNRALGAAARELVVVIADDVLVPAGALDRMRDAFTRVPALGAAFPAVPGAPGGEGVVDVEYADIAALRALAEQRALDRAREIEPVDVAVSPVFAVTREALAAIGGIDPAHGLTRRGIADLVVRLCAAGYGVVRCDDALVHRFDAALSRNPAAAADAQQPVPAADPAAVARGFDPARRVPFINDSAAASAVQLSHAIALPVAGAAELDRAATFLAATARAFDARSPVRVDVLLDGAVTPAEAAARVRPVLAACGKPMDTTLAVRIERAHDLAAWRAAADPQLRLLVAAGHERDALAGLAAAEPRSLSELLHPVAVR